MIPKPFQHQIQTALDNPVLQAALDANAERRVLVRNQAFDSIINPAGLRKRAHAVRAEVIANLDHYLEQFVERAESNGLLVHHAQDAAQAVQIVLDIARQNDVRLVAKSKTMVSEEIGLNPALESAGLQVVETDLGEYIVQLRGEHPSHIITPAVHLRRAEVGQTFHEKLGLPLTEDISLMTEAARRKLRQVFLAADMGISGVNFGVAESGTLCTITNEGNGRMVTTLPPVHVALMGIERLVPTLEDLALMLALLPRSATGQKITVYVSLIHGPRRADEAEGPAERHLVLVDNGRRQVRRSPLAEVLYCIRCGACLNACPVFREIGGHAYVSKNGQNSVYPGPIGSVLSPALFGQAEFGHLAQASSLCGACREACPVDIDLPKMLLRVRAGGVDLRPGRSPKEAPRLLSFTLSIFTWLAVSPARFRKAQRLGGIFSHLLSPNTPWMRWPAFTGWGYAKDFPRPSRRPFREAWKARIKEKKPADSLVPAESANYGKGDEHIPQAGDFPTDGGMPGAINIVEMPGSSDLADKFKEELEKLGGQTTICPSNQVNSQVLSFLNQRGMSEVVAWSDEHLPYGLLAALREAGVGVVIPADQAWGRPDRSVALGLTGAIGGIAETGTLVLPGGGGRSLAASLLPEVHLAILKAEDIYSSLDQVFSQGRLRDEILAVSSVVFVSGPSRTADIEMTLTIGVHGPKEVHVICLRG